jgi:uncharacterized protein
MKPVWVLDTNVLVSAALTAGGTCDEVLRAAIAGHVALAWSAPILAEYREVLLRPKFKLRPATVTALLAAFDPAHQVAASPAPALPDADDEIFLAAALATPDRILITGNTAHFPAKLCAPAEILTPAAALKTLRHS